MFFLVSRSTPASVTRCRLPPLGHSLRPLWQWLLAVCLALSGSGGVAVAQPGGTASPGAAAPAGTAVSADDARTLAVSVPLQLDYPLLQQLLISQLFTGPGGSQELLRDPSGCSEILASRPQLSARSPQLEILADVRAKIGVGGGGNCATMLSWQGRIGVTGTPEIRAAGTALGFAPGRVWLMDAAGEPLANPQLQSMASASVSGMLKRFQIDLLPQLEAMGELLPEVLPRHSRSQIDALLQTLRVTELQANEASLDASVAFRVEPIAVPLQPERALTEQELARWEERWQLMDSLLVLAVKHYAAATQLPELRDALLDVLIESRYRLGDALLASPGTGRDDDQVREWFLQSWQALAPIIQRIGLNRPGQEHLLVLGLIASTDALQALDQLGPSIGLDISADGLRRLARMINAGAGETLLEYSDAVDPQLRELLEQGLAAPPPPSAWRLDFSLFPRAVAAEPDRLNSWAPQRQDLEEYLPLVAELLQSSARAASERRGLDPEYAELFRQLVLATAWQESCWRHYVISDDRKLVPIRSGTGDVGLMQVNERVWRGFYDQQQLRWDIAYNSSAGTEVLLDYLLKYAIRKGEHRQPGGISNLARASYSAYNGGPSKLARYRSGNASTYGRKVDAAFWEKFQQVAAGNELAVSTCLGGNLTGPALARSAPAGQAAPKNRKSNAARAAAVSAATPENGFTLQLGAFSARHSAEAFVEQHRLGSDARIRQRRSGDASQYLVIYGSFATREEAERLRLQFARFEPWVRPLADL